MINPINKDEQFDLNMMTVTILEELSRAFSIPFVLNEGDGSSVVLKRCLSTLSVSQSKVFVQLYRSKLRQLVEVVRILRRIVKVDNYNSRFGILFESINDAEKTGRATEYISITLDEDSLYTQEFILSYLIMLLYPPRI